MLSRQAYSAKFQAKIAVNKRVFEKKTRIKTGNAISVACFKPSIIFSNEESVNFRIAENAVFCNEMLSQQAYSAKFQAKMAVNKRVLIKIEKQSSSCNEKDKTMRSCISRSLWQRFFFAATAATTIRAILPFPLHLCECFL